MATDSVQSKAIWRLARRQHGLITRGQLIDRGVSESGIRHREARGRLHELWAGVYAVGRPQVNREARLMGAVLACGPGAVASHFSAAALWKLLGDSGGPIETSVPAARRPRRRGIRVHRRTGLPASETTRCHGIPVTSPALTLVDIAPRVSTNRLEAAINQADGLDLIDPVRLRGRLDRLPRMPGVAILRRLLNRQVFVLTDSELERRFLRLVRSAGLPPPDTGARLNGFTVDFHWPDLGLVVETDGLRYHRTPAQQAKDRVRDQAHSRAGLTQLRFTHAQIAHEAEEVAATLADVIGRLRRLAGRKRGHAPHKLKA